MTLRDAFERLVRSASPVPGEPRSTSRMGLRGARYTLSDLIQLKDTARRLRLAGRVTPVCWRAGMYASRIRGRGMSFSESRLYQQGDDVRMIDWRVTARTGRTHTKVFEEEKERPVMVVCAFSESMYFGTRVAFKHVVAAELSALVGWAALAGGDRIGALLASPGRHLELRPATGRRAVMRLLDALAGLSDAPGGRGSTMTLDAALFRASRVVRPGSLVFVVGDFYDFDEVSARHIAGLAQHNDLVLCQVLDRLETSAPPVGSYPVSNGRALAEWRVPAGIESSQGSPFSDELVSEPRRCAQRYRCLYGLVGAETPVVDQLERLLSRGHVRRTRQVPC